MAARYALPRLPRSQQATIEPVENQRPARQPLQAVVLIAEDEVTIAETLAMIVEDAGYTPILARDGREALALARQHHPDLIITDLMMPFLNGADLIAAIHGDATAQGAAPPPVVVVTAASRARAEASGATIVIVKPFDVTMIESALRRLLPGDAH
jgi:CheY-like chemotaxis protein